MLFKKQRIKKAQQRHYCFKKTVDGNVAFTLYNYMKEPVYSAGKSKSVENGYEYIFKDCKKGKETVHNISRRAIKKIDGTDKLTFNFDGVDIWQMLSQLGISMRITYIADNVTDFHIFQGDEDFAVARMEKNADRSKKISITKGEASDKMLFFVFFAISRLY